MTPDAFRHHPNLARLVTPPEDSFFRNFKPSDLDARMAERGIGPDWRNPDDVIEASWRAFLAGHGDGPVWVFGYGSLMWDPGIRFDEVRRAHVPTHQRKFCLRDTLGARGTEEFPGLMVALDRGGTCEGLVFRIAPDHLEEEVSRLWNREMIAHAYRPVVTDAQTAFGTVPALAFEADHASDAILPDLTHEEQVAYAATGSGFLGSSLQYLRNVAEHLHSFGIEDAAVIRLLKDAEARAARQNAESAEGAG